MKAVRVHKPEGFEGIDGLVFEDAPDPQPAIGDALKARDDRSAVDCWRDRGRSAGLERVPGHIGKRRLLPR